MVYVLAIVIGVVAGLRSLLAPAVVAWAIRLGALDVGGTWLVHLGRTWVVWVLTAFAIGELIGDQLPTLPSRTLPAPFAARIASGALSGAAIGADRGRWVAGAIAGALGAVLGTLGGHAAGRDWRLRSVGTAPPPCWRMRSPSPARWPRPGYKGS